MATFDFSQANGTTLASIDANWQGNPTLLNCQSGVCNVTSTGGGTARVAWYQNGQGGIQSSQALVKAGTSNRRSMHVQMTSTTAASGYGYEARLSGTTDIEIRKNNTYVTQGTIPSGNTTTNDYTIKIKSNSSTGVVTVWAAAGSVADAEVSGTQIVTTTDGSPLSGGYPGFQLLTAGVTTDCAIDDWTDLVSTASTAGRNRTMMGFG